MIQGCSHQYSSEAHWGSTFWLTGANRYAIPGQSFSNTISADQVAAEVFGKATRFKSLELCADDAKGSGHGPGMSLAWDKRGKPLSGLNTVFKVYHKLFSKDDMPIEQRKALLMNKRSVLDTLLGETKRIQQGLSKTDNDKLGEYFQGIRDIETRLQKEESWMNVPKAKAPFGAPDARIRGQEEIKIMYDLIVAALQTDSTRVITYRQPVQSLMSSIGITVAPHDMSHYVPGERMKASQKRDLEQSKLLAGLIDKLKATKEVDGTSLFDHVTLAYGSNIRSIHFLDNCPTLLTGGGSKLKHGQHLVMPEGTPLCNVWLTMLQGLGLNVPSHGDSNGIIKDLLS